MAGILIGGLITGCLYVLVALGLIIIYRTTRGITFAQGDIGLVGAFVAIGLSTGTFARLPIGVAVVLGVLAAGVANILVYYLAVWRVERAGADPRGMIVGTLACGLIIEAVIPIIFGYTSFSLHLLPDSFWTVFGVDVSVAGIAIVGSAIVALIGFAFLLYKTRVGLILRMNASNDALATMTGTSTIMLRIVVWGIAGLLAGWGIILFADYQFLNASFSASFLLAAAVAASWGAFRSIPLTLVGAIVLGVLNDLIERYSPTPLTSSVSILLLVAVFIFRTRQDKSRNEHVIAERRMVRPRFILRPWLGRIDFVVALIVGVVAWVWVGSSSSGTYVNLVSLVIVVTGLSVSMLYGGRVNMGAGGYMAVGAYGTLIFEQSWHLPVFPAIVLSVIVCCAIGALLGLITAHMELIFYVTLTLVFTSAVPELVSWQAGLTGGVTGLPIGQYFTGDTWLGLPLWPLIALLIAVAALAFRQYIGLSKVGARWAFSSLHPQSGREAGFRPRTTAVCLEAIAGGLMGVGGIVAIQVAGYISPAAYTLSLSISAVVALVIGGGWTTMGIVIGAAVVTEVPQLLSGINYWPQVIYAGILLLIIGFVPSGSETVLFGRFGGISRRQRVIEESWVLGDDVSLAPAPVPGARKKRGATLEDGVQR